MRVRSALVLALFFAGCARDAGRMDSGEDAGLEGSDAGQGSDAAVREDGGGPSDAGVEDVGPRVADCQPQRFEHDGVGRAYILCVPRPLPAGPLPVVLGFHGGGGNAASWFRIMPWHELGAREGFVVVFMQGCREGETTCDTATGSFLWNVDKPGESSSVDDQGYTLAVLDRLQTIHGLNIDPSRRFATGHSLGGMFTYTLRCDQPEVFAAIGPISAAPVDESCTPSGSTSIFHIHGTMDENVPFDTGCCSRAQQTATNAQYLPGCDALPRCFNPLNWWPRVRDGIHPYADLVGLTEIAVESLGCSPSRTPVGDRTNCGAYDDCRAGTAVEECRVEGAPHNLAAIDAAFDIRSYLWSRFKEL